MLSEKINNTPENQLQWANSLLMEKLVSWNYLDQSLFHLIVIFNVLYAIFASKMNSYKISVIVLSQNANT